MQPSRQAALWLLTVHAAGLVVLPFVALPLWFQLIGLLAAAASLGWQWPRHASRRRSALQAFIWQRGRDCDIVDSNGTIRKGALLPQAFIMPWLVLLHYKTGGRRHSLFILPDMLPADTFRRLRVRLLTQADPAQTPVAHGRH